MRRFQLSKRYSVGLVILAILVATGCQNQQRQSVTALRPALPYKVEGSSDSYVMEQQSQLNRTGFLDFLNKNHLELITAGQDYLIRIPSGYLFPDRSPRIKWASYALLNQMAAYLRQFRKISVTVSAHSNECGTHDRERALTQARSRVVADYLWSQNIESRMIFTDAYGSGKSIVGDKGKGDKSKNSRIEITFRDTIV